MSAPEDIKKNQISIREQIEKNIQNRIGGVALEVDELDHDAYQVAIDYALKMYRSRSDHSLDEKFVFMCLEADQQSYVLPKEISIVKKVYRSGLNRGWAYSSATLAGSSMMTSLGISLANSFLLKGFGGNQGLNGFLTTYELYSDWLKVAGRMSGMEMSFVFNERTHTITFAENPKGVEDICLHTFCDTTDEELLTDKFAGIWLENFALAETKKMLGLARRKFTSLPGANGSIQLDGAQLYNDGVKEEEQLLNELKVYTDNQLPLGVLIG